MAHRRGSFRGRGGISESQRRKKAWAGLTNFGTDDLNAVTLQPVSLGAPGASLDLTFFDPASGGTLTLEESTILRIRGIVDVPKSVLALDGANATTIAAFGIGFVTTQAAQAGAVPNPATVLGADWDGWMFLRSSTQSPVDIQGTMMDVKAKRKWRSGESLVFVAGLATDAPAGAVSQVTSVMCRTLILLP